jgi:UDP-N-acetylmuramoyl-tripeptide--D-alanyl-D-alanine ligase
VVVLELGTDKPGDIAGFAKYVYCDLAVVTAISPEHMENFKDLGAVAQEELSVANYADKLIANIDLCEDRFLKKHKQKLITYGQDTKPNHHIRKVKFTKSGSQFEIESDDKTIKLSMDAYGSGEVYSATAAVVVAKELGLKEQQIKTAVASLQPVSGRMNRLKGIKDSLIFDDTYNASPVAVIAALDTIYGIKAPQKIAILGNMNELGEHSQKAHEEVGEYCEPSQLDLVVTIGPDANEYTAPVAEKKGCKVKTFMNPYEAAEYIKDNLKKKAVILAKGSQNGVFAEEAVKLLLADPKDVEKLVRQSKSWLKKKKKGFRRV